MAKLPPYSLNNQQVISYQATDSPQLAYANITIFNKIKSVGMPILFAILLEGDRRKVTGWGPLMALKPQEELLRVSIEVVTRVHLLRRHEGLGSLQIKQEGQPIKCDPQGNKCHHTTEALGSLYKQCC